MLGSLFLPSMLGGIVPDWWGQAHFVIYGDRMPMIMVWCIISLIVCAILGLSTALFIQAIQDNNDCDDDDDKD